MGREVSAPAQNKKERTAKSRRMGRREISAAVSTYFSPVLTLTASDVPLGDCKAGFKYPFGYSDQHRVPHRVMVLAKILAKLVCSALRGFRY